MSHRGTCPYCDEVIWMGQPAVYVEPYCVHKSCLEWECYKEEDYSQYQYELEQLYYELQRLKYDEGEML